MSFMMSARTSETFTLGNHLISGFPLGPTRNFSKFHLTSPIFSGSQNSLPVGFPKLSLTGGQAFWTGRKKDGNVNPVLIYLQSTSWGFKCINASVLADELGVTLHSVARQWLPFFQLSGFLWNERHLSPKVEMLLSYGSLPSGKWRHVARFRHSHRIFRRAGSLEQILCLDGHTCERNRRKAVSKYRRCVSRQTNLIRVRWKIQHLL